MKFPNRYLIPLLLRLRFLFNDKVYLSLMYFAQTGRIINWSNPVRFTEKLQWLKLFYRRDEFTKLVDKSTVKDIVANLIGRRYIIPTIGIWDTIDEVNWDILPNQFVLKTIQGGGSNGVYICKDKSTIDIKAIKNKFKEAQRTNIYKYFGEWPYNNIEPKIIAERYMHDSYSTSTSLSDYKFYCFNGVPKYCQVIRNRSEKESIDFYDMAWNHMPFVGLSTNVANGETPIERPIALDEMIRISSILSTDLPFARIDLYLINNQVYFGEITFYPASGFGSITPDEWDYRLGDLISLPQKY